MTDPAPSSGLTIQIGIGKDLVGGWARHGIGFAGGWMASNGYGAHDPEQVSRGLTLGVVLVVAALMWSTIQKLTRKDVP